MNNEFEFDWNDIAIVPKVTSNINSRKEITLFGLPLMVSPMDTVVDLHNWTSFTSMVICLPRGLYKPYVGFNSLSLEEFESYLAHRKSKLEVKSYYSILVDIANGHMERLYNATKEFIEIEKDRLSPIKLMVGNVANPETYRRFAELGVDYIRCGIGGGSACTTSANTGVHYPMASLVSECYAIKKQGDFKSLIVADGGFKNFDDIIKALACGADYVMLGSILNKCLESCAPTKLFGFDVSSRKEFIWQNFPSLRKYMTKSYRGMSTKAVQEKWNRETLKTAEGISKTNRVEYTIRGWQENFESYLRSAMSYTNSRTLAEFKGSEKVFITQSAFSRFHK